MVIIKGKRSKRIAKQTASAQTVASIEDLLTQILLLLPIKSLTRFKSVSKHWHSLITDPKFRCLRHPNPNPALGLLFLGGNFRVNSQLEYVPFSRSTITPPFMKLDFTKDPFKLRILQSCNGLLLCSSLWADHPTNMQYYVYNPTTGRFSALPGLENIETLPGLEDIENDEIVRGMSLAFDPAKSPHYKVVCVRALESDSRNQIEIYSSDAGPWRLSGKPFAGEANFKNGVYWNGSIHWISAEPGDSFYFNVNDQSLQTMPATPVRDGQSFPHRCYLGESCDRLYYVETTGLPIEFDVYEMKRDYSEWFVKYRVDLSPVVDAFPGPTLGGMDDPTERYYYDYSVFCVVGGKEEDEFSLVFQIPGQVIQYNLVYKTFELVHQFVEDPDMWDCLWFSPSDCGYQYIESLCCV